MNSLDAIFLVAAVLAAIGGWRFGFLKRVLGWAGLLVGVVIASRVLPLIFDPPDTPTPGDLIRSLLVLLAGGMIGQTLGHFLGGRAKRLLGDDSAHLIDAAGGALVGVCGVVLMAWMVIPTMAQIQGWPANAARGSEVAARLARALGTPPDVLRGVGDSLGVAGLGDALSNIRDLHTDPSAPADSPVPESVRALVDPSVLRISGPACGRTQTGSGFVIAPHLVVTNAHVVAGDESVSLSDDHGLKVSGTVRYLDIRNDIALILAPTLDRPPLPLIDPAVGSKGTILGYPGGGSLTSQPYEVAVVTTATAQDIYDEGKFLRRIVIVGSQIGPGDSGGPMVTPDGHVAGIAFGIAPDRQETAYGIPAELLRDLTAKVSAEPLDTGRCRVG